VIAGSGIGLACSPPAMDISIKKILGWQRSAAGCTFFMEIEIGGTVQGTCRLILPTDAEVETMQKLLGDARADARRTRPGDEPPPSTDH
jgi:hypothetical protein